MDVYNKNRDQNRSMHDEIREQNAKLKGAPLREKLNYFKEYYLKATLFIAAAAVLIIYIAYSIITAPKDTAFGAFFYNAYGDSSNTGLADGFAEYMNIDTKKSDVYIDSSVYLTETMNDTDSYMSIEKTMAVISTGELDVIVGDAGAVDYFTRAEYLSDITDVLPEDMLEQFSDKLYYAKPGEDAESVPVGIRLGDCEKLNQYYMFKSEPIICFVVNSNSIDNAVAFLKYLYM